MTTTKRCERNYRASSRPPVPSKKNAFGKRMAFDAVLTVFIVVEMFIQYTGVFLHEVIGAVFAVSIVAHLIVERKWIGGAVKAFGAGRISGKRKALAIVAAILLVCMVLLVASSVIISTVLFSFGLRTMALNPGGIWYPIHTASSYALCAATIVHLAMHWSMVASFFKVPYNPSRRVAIGRGVGAMAAAGVVAVGVSAAKALDVAEALADAGAEEESIALAGEGNGATGESVEAAAQEANDATKADMVAEDRSADGEDLPAKSSRDAAQEVASASAQEASVSSAEGSATEITGICTLCKKRCPLSAPLCDKPYIAGLIPMP